MASKGKVGGAIDTSAKKVGKPGGPSSMDRKKYGRNGSQAMNQQGKLKGK